MYYNLLTVALSKNFRVNLPYKELVRLGNNTLQTMDLQIRARVVLWILERNMYHGLCQSGHHNVDFLFGVFHRGERFKFEAPLIFLQSIVLQTCFPAIMCLYNIV